MVGKDLLVAGEGLEIRVPFSRVCVDERLGHAPRRLRFEDGASCEVSDLAALDALLSLAGHRDGALDRWQRQWLFTLLACLACIVLSMAGYKFALPWLAARGAQKMPPFVARTLSSRALAALDGRVLLPSHLDVARQQTLRGAFAALRLPEGGRARGVLLFRASPELGANAFTLPDGTIVVLDELISTIDDDQQMLAVIAHELGHAHGKHSLQLLLQSSAVAAFWSFYIGDVSHLLAAAPAAIVQARYSQALERQADDYAAALLLENGMSPTLLADALKKVAASQGSAAQNYLSSHPPTDERMRHLRALADVAARVPARGTPGADPVR